MKAPPRMLRAALATALAAAAAGCSSPDREDLGSQVYLHNAQGYAEGGHWDQALDQFRRALELDPDNQKALLGEATSLYWLGTGETAAAGRAIEEAEQKIDALDPEDFDEQDWKVRLTSAMVHGRLAELWGRKADLVRADAAAGSPEAVAALAAAEKAFTLHDEKSAALFLEVLAETDEPLARNNLEALRKLAARSALRASKPEEYAEALDYLKRYETEVTRSRALWIEMKKREPDLAEVYDRKLKRAERQEIELRDLVANLLYKRRDHKGSLAEIDRILALDPARAGAWLARAQNHEELGRWGDAADDYRRFLQLTTLPSGSEPVLQAAERMAKCEEKARAAGSQ